MDERDAGPVRWVPIGSYPFRGYAAFVASALEGSGIPTQVVGDDAGGVLTGIGMMTGGVHVEVPEHEVDAARELLASLPAADEDLEGWRDGPPEGDPDLAADRPHQAGPGALDPGQVPEPPSGAGRAAFIAVLILALALALVAMTDVL
jgi:hypothetical protein